MFLEGPVRRDAGGVEVDGVRDRAVVRHLDVHALALPHVDHGARRAARKRPSRELHAGRDLQHDILERDLHLRDAVDERRQRRRVGLVVDGGRGGRGLRVMRRLHLRGRRRRVRLGCRGRFGRRRGGRCNGCGLLGGAPRREHEDEDDGEEARHEDGNCDDGRVVADGDRFDGRGGVGAHARTPGGCTERCTTEARSSPRSGHRRRRRCRRVETRTSAKSPHVTGRDGSSPRACDTPQRTRGEPVTAAGSAPMAHPPGGGTVTATEATGPSAQGSGKCASSLKSAVSLQLPCWWRSASARSRWASAAARPCSPRSSRRRSSARRT